MRKIISKTKQHEVDILKGVVATLTVGTVVLAIRGTYYKWAHSDLMSICEQLDLTHAINAQWFKNVVEG